MDDLVKEVIPLLQYLIPGFIAAWIFYSLTSFKRPDSFGQIIQALMFTYIIQVIVGALGYGLQWVGSNWFLLGPWDASAKALCSGLVAITLGLAACYFVNSDKLHKMLRAAGVTVKTSYPSEWFSAFTTKPTFVVLNLKDERRLYGWPFEWPSDPSSGQFVILDPSWLDGTKEVPLGIDSIVIDVSQVQWVEFTNIKEVLVDD